MEYLLELLSVDVHSEVYLIRTVKVAVEDAYFFMKREGAARLTTENLMDVNKLIVQLELQRVDFLRKISPSGLLYCV
jgi:membrane protein CcdC involved in cytochrome C biogenesis